MTLVGFGPRMASAQFERPSGRPSHQPLNQRSVPGIAGKWALMLGRSTRGYLQPVEVQLLDITGKPMKGRVTWYEPRRRTSKTLAAPAFARIAVGGVYRIRIDALEKFPGVSLYPSIELIDRLHPPAGKADRFPVPIQFTAAEIEQAAQGRMVSKVIYLEQPQLASRHDVPIPTSTLSSKTNLIHEADRRGRPMAIIRLGSRQPKAGMSTRFFGLGGPIQYRK